MIDRTLASTILKNSKPGFITVIYGSRRVGKTSLLHQLAPHFRKPHLWLNGDTEEARSALSSTSEIQLSQLVSSSETIFVDEAQRIPNIGLSLKILIDKFPQKRIVVTGSFSLGLSLGIQEPLTGRTHKYILYPLSTSELATNLKSYQIPSLLPQQLTFGGYPYLSELSTDTEKSAYLTSIVDDYLFKDIFLLKEIAQPDNLKKLATLLAFQIGSEVSLNELANALNIDIKTVSRYLSFLKDTFIIFELSALSTNPRKEISKSKKYFFFDLGIRNALTNSFLSLDIRPDVGHLWENFLAIERIKNHAYKRMDVQYFFWRSYSQSEIDWIERTSTAISALEFKWKSARPKTPITFLSLYKTEVQFVTKANYLDFIN